MLQVTEEGEKRQSALYLLIKFCTLTVTKVSYMKIRKKLRYYLPSI